jgi:trimeric autotransporter adhesin
MLGEAWVGRASRIVALLGVICLLLWSAILPSRACGAVAEAPAFASSAALADSLPDWGVPPSDLKTDDLWSAGFRYEGGLDGLVTAVVEFEGELVAVGGFTSGDGVALNHVGRWDGATWRPMGAGLPSTMFALAVYGGQLFAGGYRWDGADWVDVLQTDGTVLALVVQGSDLIAAGAFTQAAGQPVNRILRWDGSAVHALGDGLDNDVYALAAGPQGLFAGGLFSHAGGVPAARVARWDGASWSPLGEGIGGDQEWCCDEYYHPVHFSPYVGALAIYGGDLVVGGRFATAGTDTIHSLARWDGAAWHALGGDISDFICTVDPIGNGTCSSPSVTALLPRGDELIVAGSFWRVGSQEAINIASWDGQTWHALGPGLGAGNFESEVGSGVSDLATFGDRLVAGGFFFNSGSSSLNRLAVWDGTSWSRAYSLGLGLDGEVRDMLVDDGRLIVAGGFNHAGDLAAGAIAAFDGEHWAPFGGAGAPGASFVSGIFALARFEGDIIAAGYFGTIGGVAALNVARWDGLAWHAMGAGIPREVGCLAVHDGALYAGTETRWSTNTSARVYRWDGAAWQCDVTVTYAGLARIAAMASYGGRLIVGGSFAVANGDSMGKLFSWDGATCRPLGGGIGGGYGVLSMANQGADLLVGGGFYTAGGLRATYIARWDGTSWSALGPGLNGGTSHYGVYDILVRGDQVFAFGNFTSAGDQPITRVAMWNGREWRGFGAGVGSVVFSGALLDGDLYVGGAFNRAGTQVAANFARWREPGLPVYLSGFTAAREARGARLAWQVNGAAGEDGFHVWRQEAGLDRVRLTTTPLPVLTSREFFDATAPAAAADYWLQEVTADGLESWYGPARLPAIRIPTALVLSQNHPNPFNPRTSFSFSLPQPTRTTLGLYDQRGRLVRTLIDAVLPAGEHAVDWDGRDARGAAVASGTYIARLVTEQGTRTSKVTLAR